VFQDRIIYDGYQASPDCSISKSNEGLECQMRFYFNESVTGPIYVYYELNRFYQNHRRYVSSVDYYQLDGTVRLLTYLIILCNTLFSHEIFKYIFLQSQSESSLKSSCNQFVNNGSLIYSPCGLIANSYFTGS
jgi:hypothetical protein